MTTDEPKQDDTKAPQIDADTPITEEMLRSYPETPASDFEYDEWPDSVTIKKYIGSDLVVVVPKEINGKPVTEVYSYLFANKSEVRAARFPDTIDEVTIPFGNNKHVELVIFEGTKKISGEGAFVGCSSLHTVIFDKDLEELGAMAFSMCGVTKVYIPASLTSIDPSIADSLFYGHSDDLVIYGEAGSYIETYAKEQGIPFQAE